MFKPITKYSIISLHEKLHISLHTLKELKYAINHVMAEIQV